MILIDTDDGRTVADTDGMLNVVRARRWDVRRYARRPDIWADVECPDGETRRLYDAHRAEALLRELDEPGRRDILVTAAQATEFWGIRAGTVRQWKSVGKVESFECNERGHPLYSAADLLRLAGLDTGVGNSATAV